MKKSCLIIIILLLNILMGYSQITTNEQPISVQKGLDEITKRTITRSSSFIDLPIPDLQEVYRENMDSTVTSIAIPVSLKLSQKGNWILLKDGGKLWQLAIHAKDAKAIDFVFDKFWLPDGGKFFIFNPHTKETIGAITSKYLQGTKAEPNRFSTDVVKGDLVILEYYQPQEVCEQPVVNISKVYYSYRDPLEFDSSCYHNVNVNCPEGDDWNFEKRAVALVYRKFTQRGCWGSGALVNNTQNDFSPLFLTADHLLKLDLTNEGGYLERKDAILDNDLSDWIFYWGYQTYSCNSNTQPGYHTTTGATIKANNTDYADFALLQLTQSPWDLADYKPYHLGWDRSGNCGTGGVCIHHPMHDVKKISTYNMTPNTTSVNNSPSVYWELQWVSTPNGYGITQDGSSGAPLINSNHKVIGQLWGGNTTCTYLTGTSIFGKFSVSCTGNNTTEPRRRLSPWLDPSTSFTTTLDGLGEFKIISNSSSCNNTTYRIDYLPSGWSVNWSYDPSGSSSSPSGLVQMNTPQVNQCRLYNSGNDHLIGKLEARISNTYNNEMFYRYVDINTGEGFTGTYQQVDNFNLIPNNIPPTSFSDGDTFIVGPKCDVYIRSTCLPGTTITHTGANLNYWNYSLDGSYGVIHLRFPYKTTNQYLTIKAVDNTNCKIYEFYVDAIVNPLSNFSPTLSTSSDGQRLNITMGVESEDDETAKAILSSETVRWDVMVCNAVTGKVMCENHVEGWSQEIDTIGWPSGVYVIKAQAGEHFVTQKVAIK